MIRAMQQACAEKGISLTYLKQGWPRKLWVKSITYLPAYPVSHRSPFYNLLYATGAEPVELNTICDSCDNVYKWNILDISKQWIPCGLLIWRPRELGEPVYASRRIMIRLDFTARTSNIESKRSVGRSLRLGINEWIVFTERRQSLGWIKSISQESVSDKKTTIHLVEPTVVYDWLQIYLPEDSDVTI